MRTIETTELMSSAPERFLFGDQERIVSELEGKFLQGSLGAMRFLQR